jgi:transcriptional regulator with XRE-family HTH domain
MKTETPSVQPVLAVFPCAVCGAQLDLRHVELLGHGGALCSFCGAKQWVGSSETSDGGDGSLHLPAPTDVGDALREARHERGESLEQVSRATRVRESYLRALEEDEQSFEPFPGRVYARFFLREYAEYLGLDPEPLLRRFDHDAQPALTTLPPTPLFRRAPRPRRWAVAALVVLVAMLGAAAAMHRDGSQRAALSASPAHLTSPAQNKAGAGRATRPPAITRIDAVVTTIGSEPSWVKVTADGSTIFEQVMSGGQTQRFHARRTLELTLGSAGAVRLRVDGRIVATGVLGEVQQFGWAVRDGRLVRT